MSVTTESQLEAIRSMMASGHRSVKIEKHTLYIWGLTSAALILFIEYIYRFAPFEPWLHNVVETVIISVTLIIAGIIDFRLTKKVRRLRGESLSFVQIQVTKIWWFLIGLIVFVNLGMNFFGGGYIFYPVLIFILGLAFFVHGLFSAQLYSWLGHALILLAAAAVLLQVPYFSMRWIAVFVLGLGFPIIALIQDKPIFIQANLVQKIVITSIWLLIIIFPSVVAYNIAEGKDLSNLKVLSLQEYASLNEQQKSRAQYVRIPAGHVIPMQFEFISDSFMDGAIQTTVPIKMSDSMDIEVKQAEATGPFRIGNASQASILRIHPISKESHFNVSADLDIVMKYRVDFKR